MRIAVIDLGTNTFNLLIAEVLDHFQYQILRETKQPAKLGKGGINHRMITPDAFERGIQALKSHLVIIESFGVELTIGIATSAIRNALNGKEFVDYVHRNLGLNITVIDGLKEAQLIFDGVKQVVPIGKENVLILDIGGGSNEFIIANKSGVVWKQSFELGMARILDRFKPSDPILPGEIEKIETYFKQELSPLFHALRNHPVNTMVGSSGSFDTIAAMIAADQHPSLDMSKVTSYRILLDHFDQLHDRLTHSTSGERMRMDRMDPDRVDMIVLASLFIRLIVRECHLSHLWQCPFALKEGAIYQVVRDQFKS